MLDLALGVPEGLASRYFLVAPDRREADARAQFARPAFQSVNDMDLRFLPYSELQAHRDTMARFAPRIETHRSLGVALALNARSNRSGRCQ